MWKVSYSNGLIVEVPEEYDNKVRFFVGPGNNSNLLKGVMLRRPWWALTDKIQEASFVWTQIKIGSIFEQQYRLMGKTNNFAKNISSENNIEADEFVKYNELSFSKSQNLFNGMQNNPE